MRVPPGSEVRAIFNETYTSAVDLLVASGSLSQAAAPRELAEQGVGTWGTDPVDFSVQWADFTEAQAALALNRYRSPATGLQARTIRSAARICLPSVVEAACVAVAGYRCPEARTKEEAEAFKNALPPTPLERDPRIWRLVMDQLPLGMDIYPRAGLMADLRRRPLVSRGRIADMIEVATTTPRAARYQRRSLAAVTEYAMRRRNVARPPNAIVAGIVGEVALAQSYGNLGDTSRAATTISMLRMRRLHRALTTFEQDGTYNLGALRDHLLPADIAWASGVRQRYANLMALNRRRRL